MKNRYVYEPFKKFANFWVCDDLKSMQVIT
jgi:hypothetical protein